jgi:predicted nucleotidyltransferase
MELGSDCEMEYLNPEDKKVTSLFRGLKNLLLIYDKLEDGAELVYEEEFDVPEETIQEWVTPKERLVVFAPRPKGIDKPNNACKEIQEEAIAMLERMGVSRDDL